jgi:hypothetical protein
LLDLGLNCFQTASPDRSLGLFAKSMGIVAVQKVNTALRATPMSGGHPE